MSRVGLAWESGLVDQHIESGRVDLGDESGCVCMDM